MGNVMMNTVCCTPSHLLAFRTPGALRTHLMVLAVSTTLLISARSLYLIRLTTANNPPTPLAAWNSLARFPPWLQRWVFTKLIHRYNPFSRTGRIRVIHYDVGYAKTSVTEQRSLQNPFRSIHAAEIALLGETAAGLALFSLTETTKQRAIVTSMNCTYLHKARGTVVAIADCTQLEAMEIGPKVSVEANIYQEDHLDKLLATVTVTFAVSAKKE